MKIILKNSLTLARKHITILISNKPIKIEMRQFTCKRLTYYNLHDFLTTTLDSVCV